MAGWLFSSRSTALKSLTSILWSDGCSREDEDPYATDTTVNIDSTIPNSYLCVPGGRGMEVVNTRLLSEEVVNLFPFSHTTQYQLNSSPLLSAFRSLWSSGVLIMIRSAYSGGRRLEMLQVATLFSSPHTCVCVNVRGNYTMIRNENDKYLLRILCITALKQITRNWLQKTCPLIQKMERHGSTNISDGIFNL